MERVRIEFGDGARVTVPAHRQVAKLALGTVTWAGRPCRPPGGRSGHCNAATAGIGRGGGVVAPWPAPTTRGLRAPAICVPSY